ncbi:hypothetical protein G6F57_003446 [Rhizopus arrhizus]|nr:hypothetical protein G6F23_006983 [Rhizopus arrhizus]KAG1413503.1 hypothetical protein G6F58_007454 [Rhizopus delemar]KAG0769214.1 hypothetical protein G6F24_001268 [Rhizopus arrhizus]KAG0913675.1 hypothetical protein G6F33_004945 [Rhizopus arrhizus]KAG0944563.1 hypothetical protein G6F30_004657 [Rhizopus arrhizus]
MSDDGPVDAPFFGTMGCAAAIVFSWPVVMAGYCGLCLIIWWTCVEGEVGERHGSGIAIGMTGDAGVRATAQQPRMFVGMYL